MHNDFPNDKKVLKEDDSINVKDVALLSLMAADDDLPFDPMKLIAYMIHRMMHQK